MKNIIRIGSKKISLDRLFEKYSPKYGGFKQRVFERALAKFSDRRTYGIPTIHVEKFQCKPLDKIDLGEGLSETEILLAEDFFDYSDLSDQTKKVWYLNYADKLLFGYYDSDMFGQDEIQTLEHPALAAVQGWLDKKNYKELKALTITNKIPTPFIIENVPRWISVNTKDYPIYGHLFKDACEREDWDLLEKAIKVVEEERLNNIIAVAAPAGGKGRYTKARIAEALMAIIAAFGGAAFRNADEAGNERSTVIHSGRWGAGAFGGNEELLLACQIIGAKIVGVQTLVLHSVNNDCCERALGVVKEIGNANFKNADKIADFLFERKYEWNVSDGN